MDTKKVKGFDFLVELITFAVIFMSYLLTTDSLKNIQNIQETQNLTSGFLRSAFVFLAPCSLEVLSLVVSEVGEKPKIEAVEKFVGGLSILLSLYLWFAITNDVSLLKASWIKWLLLMYPLKISVSLMDKFFELFK